MFIFLLGLGAASAFAADTLASNQSLQQGHSLVSGNGTYSANYQTDGNFVVYKGTTPLWASNTSGKTSTQLVMQGDGNLVIYNNTTPVWATNTSGHANSSLVMQNDGNLVIYQGTTAIWATNTVQAPPPPTPPPPQPIATVTFGAFPSTISPGGVVQLSWSGPSGGSCSASSSPTNFQWVSSLPSSGAIYLNLTETTTFTVSCGGPQSGGDTKQVTVTVSPAVPATGYRCKTPGYGTDGCMEYHGGDLMLNPTVHIIWYGNWASESALTILPQFIRDLTGSSYFNILQTYNVYGHNFPTSLTLGQQIFDHYSHGTSINALDIVTSALDQNLLPENSNSIYLVLTSKDVSETHDRIVFGILGSKQFCRDDCGYHDNHHTGPLGIGGTNIRFAHVGDAETQCPSNACGHSYAFNGLYPNDDFGADAMVSVISHEIFEAITDPDGDGWYHLDSNSNPDPNGEATGEIGDLCNAYFGNVFPTPSNLAPYNFSVGGRYYLVQQEWVNAGGGGCAMSIPGGPPPPPPTNTRKATVSVSVPATMVTGQQYTATFTVTNTGTMTWSPVGSGCNAFLLGSQNPQDNSTWGGRLALPNTVAPGASVTFNAVFTAPATAGVYNFQWEMLQECVTWFGTPSANVAVNVVAPAPNATISASVAANMAAGQQYTATFTVTNTGTIPWSTIGPQCNAFRLGSQNPTSNTNWSVTSRVELPSTVAVGGSITFNAPVTAPATPGIYNFQWQMLQECVTWFATPSANIVVAVIALPTNNPIPGARDISDFNHDGQTDFLWQYTDGSLADWFMNGLAMTSSAYIQNSPISGWTVVGTGDFNADGNTDIVWQNTNGTVAVWFMNGNTFASSAYIYAQPGSGWTVRGVADLNHDGWPDLIAQTADGSATVAYMKGLVITGTASISGPQPGWRIAGTGDFNGDGQVDLVWQNINDGTVTMWFMNGATMTSWQYVYNTPLTDWRIAGTGDFNGDGKADILWQRVSDGSLSAWFMNGASIASTSYFYNHPIGGWTLRYAK